MGRWKGAKWGNGKGGTGNSMRLDNGRGGRMERRSQGMRER